MTVEANQIDRLPALVADLIRLPVAVIVVRRIGFHRLLVIADAGLGAAVSADASVINELTANVSADHRLDRLSGYIHGKIGCRVDYGL
jgi:hypothetical protein